MLAAPGFDAVAWLRRTEAPFDLRPDLTLLFDLDPAVALERVGRRGEKEKFERLDLLVRVRENYLRLAREDSARYVVVDASRTPSEVLASAVAAAQDRLR